MASKRPKEEKSVDDIKWLEEEVPGKGKQALCTLGDARIYLGVSEVGLTIILDENGIVRYERGRGNTKLVLKSDLDEINRLRPVDESRISPKQLLEQAAQLFQQIQANGDMVEAIAQWLAAWGKIKD